MHIPAMFAATGLSACKTASFDCNAELIEYNIPSDNSVTESEILRSDHSRPSGFEDGKN